MSDPEQVYVKGKYDPEQTAKRWIKHMGYTIAYANLTILLNKAYNAGQDKVRKIYRGDHGYGRCPLCHTHADADEVDIGVGMQQVGPVFCPSCLAYQNDNGTWHPGPDWIEAGEEESHEKGSEAACVDLRKS